jgi:putative endonuclease
MAEPTGKHWLVYMIRADDGRYYTGITTDMVRRWHQHGLQKNGAKFFRGRKPAALVYIESGHDRSSASRREAAIKALTRSAKQLLLAAPANALHTPAGAQILASLSCEVVAEVELRGGAVGE